MDPTPDPAPSASKGRRYDSLDSLRGLAAVTVVVAHILGPLIGEGSPMAKAGGLAWRLFWATPLRFVVDGGACVILFFVLSGFVLALPYCDGRPPRYGPYLVRRFCRIYLPYIAAVALAIAVKSWLYRGPVPWLGHDLNREWALPTTGPAVLHHLLLITSVDQRFDPVTWSLTHEMRFSIAFPLVMALVLRFRAWQGLAFSVLVAVAGFSGEGFFKRRGPAPDLLQTLTYLPMFVAGALMARHRPGLSRWGVPLPTWARAGVLLAGLSLIGYRGMLPFFVARLPLQYLALTLGSCLLIASALTWPRLDRSLSTPAPVFLGRVSYSIYLVHLIIFLGLASALSSSWPSTAIRLLSIVLVLPAAAAAYELVERPSIALGRRLTRASARRPAPTGAEPPPLAVAGPAPGG